MTTFKELINKKEKLIFALEIKGLCSGCRRIFKMRIKTIEHEIDDLLSKQGGVV